MIAQWLEPILQWSGLSLIGLALFVIIILLVFKN